METTLKTTERTHAGEIREKKKRNTRAAAYAEKIMREVEALERKGAGYDIDAAIDEAALHTKY